MSRYQFEHTSWAGRNPPECRRLKSRQCWRTTMLRATLKLSPLLLIGGFLMGCTAREPSKTPLLEPPRVRPERIVAQGQILPAKGLIRLAATPGDTVDEVHVAIGDRVNAGQPLIVMHSHKIRRAQLESLDRRYEAAEQQQAATIEQAQLRVVAAELRVKQAEAQFTALPRQAEMLELAKSQVMASEKVLHSLESIAEESLTKAFVGRIDLERQRSAVTEAELKLKQQTELLTQSEEAAEWSKSAAQQELTAAQTALKRAQESTSLAALASERQTLELQLKAAIIAAPRDAVVVAINTQVGESAAQFPLIELAETSQIICAVEVVEADASLIAPGQSAVISSPALPRELRGTVLRRDHLVGRPQLPSADPLAKADYRTANVIVELLPEDAAVASTWLQLQVKAEIDVAPANEAAQPSADAAHAP